MADLRTALLPRPQCLDFEVLGMMCGSCAGTVERAAMAADAPVARVQVNLLAETASAQLLEYLPDDALAAAAAAIVEAIEDAGFDAKLRAAKAPDALVQREVLLRTEDAAQAVEVLGKSAHAVEGGVRVRFEAEEEERGVRGILFKLEEKGVKARPELGAASPLESAKARRAEEERLWRKGFFQALALTLPLLTIMWVLCPLGRTEVAGYDLAGPAMWLLATPVQFGSGAAFYRDAAAGLRHRRLGMAAMVALGSSAAYFSSCLKLFAESEPADLDFDTSSLLLTFVLLGKWLECRAKGSTGDAITALLSLQPRTALLLEEDSVKEVDARLLLKNDLVKVLPGARIPADGVVSSGESAVDESAITGESLPVFKCPGSKVVGGTMNSGGALVVKLHAVGKSSALAQIVGLVEAAQAEKAPVQELADRISGFFVPAVMALAALTFTTWVALLSLKVVGQEENLWSFSLMRGVAVLVVACPCALGLAAPTAVMVGTGVGAANGVLIKGSRALESAHHVDAVVFDKTGTITEGKPAVTDLELLGECALEDVAGLLKAQGSVQMAKLLPALHLAGCVEASSEHPLGKALAKEARRLCAAPQAEPEAFKATPGRGVEARVLGHDVKVGSAAWLELELDEGAKKKVGALEEEGKTVVVVVVDGVPALAAALADKARPEAAATIAALQKSGREVFMLTGDNARTAAAVARSVGIKTENVVAGVLPAGKAERLKELQVARKGRRCVAMVGDGVNDAPALAQADLGVAIGAGAEVALEAADVVLVRSRLGDVATALHLASTIFRRVQLNFLFSLGYNLLAIPLAAGGWYALTGKPLAPFVSGAAMAMSSVSVVGSSLLLKNYKAPSTLPATKCWWWLSRSALLAQRDEQRKAAEAAGKLYVQGLMEDCASLWGGACDCASRPSGCRCRGQCAAAAA